MTPREKAESRKKGSKAEAALPCVSLGKQTKSIYIECKSIRREMQTYECKIHGRCIKNLHPGVKWFSRPEAKIYHLCYGCKDFSTSDQESP